MFILTFSHVIDGHRVPLIEDGRAVTMQIEAASKSAAINDPKVSQFCTDRGNDCRVRSVL